ncbi:MAG: hypothetical protein AAB035_03960 [Nitrospirota bacterium]
MRIKLLVASVAIALFNFYPAFAVDDKPPVKQQTDNSFNPAMSLILDGRYANFNNNPEAYTLPGFALGGESGLGEEGLSLGHTELAISGNVDDKFYGRVALIIDQHAGHSELGLEEAFIQTLGLGHGLTITAGHFFSAIGYLNEQHEHAWDFGDAPLIYRGLFVHQLRDNGLQVSFVATTNTFLQLGAEAFSGSRFPAGGEQEDIGAWTVFANMGGDIGIENSWLLGLGHWNADDITNRISSGHGHGASPEIPSFAGNSKITAIDIVYKWAPNGNAKDRNFKVQLEYFDRREAGTVTLLESSPLENTDYDGHQKGGYVQTVYQFMPEWRTGFRYDHLESDNDGSDYHILSEARLDNEGHTPKRYSAMIEWLPSEFSRIRLQYNHDESSENADDQTFLQYTHSLGSHGAHQF